MADYKGVNYTKSETPTAPNIMDGREMDAVVKMHTETYEASAVAQNKTMALFKDLTDGLNVVGGIVYFDALGSNSSISIGDSNDADRYLTTTTTTSAGSAIFNAVNGINYKLGTNDGDNTMLLTAVGSGALSGTIKVVLFYTN